MREKREVTSREVFLLIFFIAIVSIIFVRMQAINSKFFIYIIIIFALVPVFWFGGKHLHRRMASKCPKCGGPMNYMGVSKVFRGTLNKDGGDNFPSLGKKILRCLDCENEYQELVYYSSSTGDAIDHSNLDDTRLEVIQAVYRSEIPMAVNRIQHKSITQEQYNSIKEKLAKEVSENNLRAGFSDNGIRIKV